MITRWMIAAGLGLLGCVGIGLGGAEAADVILPIQTPTAASGGSLGSFPFTVKCPPVTDPSTRCQVPNHPPVTLAIVDPVTGLELTNWAPVPGQAVRIVVKLNDVPQNPAQVPPPVSISLVPPRLGPYDYNGNENPFLKAGLSLTASPTTTSLGTSAYRGQAYNVGNPTGGLDIPDYAFTAPDLLTPTDSGGFAVVKVTVNTAPPTMPNVEIGDYYFFVPQDGDASYATNPSDPRNSNGMPAWVEKQVCTTVPCPTGREDDDLRLVSSTLKGDLISALDEYRGGRFNQELVRTDPRLIDIAFFLVNPQCVGAQNLEPTPQMKLLTRLAPGFAGSKTQYPTEGGPGLFDFVRQLYGDLQTHMLSNPNAPNYGSTEFVNEFLGYELATGQRFVGAQGPASTPSPNDRWLNQYAVIPVMDATGTLLKAKVIRAIECVDPAATKMAFAGIVSVNATGYVIINSEKIISVVDGNVTEGAGRRLKYSTYSGAGWTTPVLVGNGIPTEPANVDFLKSQCFAAIAAHESGHTGSLTGGSGGHYTSSGYYLDADMCRNEVDRKADGFNRFYIQSAGESYQTPDKQSHKLR